MTVFKVVLGAATLWPVLFLLASQRDPPTPVVAPDPVAERWPTEIPIAPKADRLPIAVAAEPAPAAVIEVPVQVAAARTDVLQTVGATASARRHTEHHDICARHGMRKVVTHRGRSWRCRR